MWRLRAYFGDELGIETEHATLSEALARLQVMNTNLFNLPTPTRITLVRKGKSWNSGKNRASGKLKDSGMRTFPAKPLRSVPGTQSTIPGQMPLLSFFEQLIPDVKLYPWQREYLDRLVCGLDVPEGYTVQLNTDPLP